MSDPQLQRLRPTVTSMALGTRVARFCARIAPPVDETLVPLTTA